MSIAYVTVGDLRPSPWSRTLAAITVANAIKTSIATATSIQTYITAALNGSIGAAQFSVPQYVTVTTTAATGSYLVTTIVVTGLDEDGNVITSNLALTLVNGGETITSTVAFYKVTSIVVPAQFDTGGHFVFGVNDVIFTKPIREVRGGSAGNVVVTYQDATSDTVPLTAGERHLAYMFKITASGTTALPITIYA